MFFRTKRTKDSKSVRRRTVWRSARDAVLSDASVKFGSAIYVVDRHGRIKRLLPEGRGKASKLAPSEEFAEAIEQDS